MHMVHVKHPYTQKEKIKERTRLASYSHHQVRTILLELDLRRFIDPSPCHKWLQLSPVLTVVANMNWVSHLYGLSPLVLT